MTIIAVLTALTLVSQSGHACDFGCNLEQPTNSVTLSASKVVGRQIMAEFVSMPSFGRTINEVVLDGPKDRKAEQRPWAKSQTPFEYNDYRPLDLMDDSANGSLGAEPRNRLIWRVGTDRLMR
jgi:hypothetical protein